MLCKVLFGFTLEYIYVFIRFTQTKINDLQDKTQTRMLGSEVGFTYFS